MVDSSRRLKCREGLVFCEVHNVVPPATSDAMSPRRAVVVSRTGHASPRLPAQRNCPTNCFSPLRHTGPPTPLTHAARRDTPAMWSAGLQFQASATKLPSRRRPLPAARPPCLVARRHAAAGAVRQQQQRWPWHTIPRAAALAAAAAAAADDPSATQPALIDGDDAAAAATGGVAASTALAPPPAAAADVGLSLSELWQLLQQDRRRLAACIAFTAVSVASAVLVAPCLGRVVDIISRGTAATPRELAVAVGRLGTVYVIANVGMAVQVALSLALGEGLAHRLRCRLFGALLSRDTLFFDQVKTGQMVAWLGQDVEVLQVTCCRQLLCQPLRLGLMVGVLAVAPAERAPHCTLFSLPHPATCRALCPSCWVREASAALLRRAASSLSSLRCRGPWLRPSSCLRPCSRRSSRASPLPSAPPPRPPRLPPQRCRQRPMRWWRTCGW